MHFLYDTWLAALIEAFNDKDCDWLWHCGQWAVWFGVLCHPLMHPWYTANTFSLLLLLFYPFKTCPLFKILLSFVLVSSPASFLWDLLVEAVMWTDTGLPCLSSRWCYFKYVCHAAGPLQDVPWSEGERNVIRSPTGGLHIRTCRHSCLSSAAFSICVLFNYLMKINQNQRSSSPLQEQHYIALRFICALMCVLKMTLCHFNTTSSYMKLTYVCQTHRNTRWLLRLSHFASPPSPLEDIWKTLRAKKAFKWHTNLSASKLVSGFPRVSARCGQSNMPLHFSGCWLTTSSKQRPAHGFIKQRFPSSQLDPLWQAAASEGLASRKSCCKGSAHGSPHNDIMRRCGEWEELHRG